ncbi:MAG TPA: peptidylprolyl isomerase [candidate division Zixibacteria bacterium]|nr:peptidylprolyl isomerase [candidate division Zixibacteria bacterium]MDD4917283.1 peptidylprolyl isomerase [candidate division Zixibacteria bacterium]MDM7973485.1 peptidylprolyl isomerase [candidate division Zixibacteria bacterium]HOD65437.1 peptidylprolyl isomerase [candidate division Zixibacteria bacterium]HPM36787.1 peptidylprolyl isomerase [candidate division Zixibacteria bacterium]
MKRLRLGAIAVLLAVAGYYAYDRLTPPTRIDKLAQIIHLEDRRELSGRLKSYLGDSDPAVRARAALAVGRIGGPGSAEPLLDLLADSSWEVAGAAATAIGFCGQPEFALRLLETADNLPPRITARAVESAGRLADTGKAEVIDALLAYLSHPAPEVRERAVRGLFRAGARSAAAEVIGLYGEDFDEPVRQACLYFLARFDIAAGKEIFASYLADPDPNLRGLAVRGMGAVAGEEAERYVSIALNDNTDRVVAQAIAELAGRDPDRVSRLLQKKLAVEEDPKLIVELIEALRRLGSSEGIATAEEALAAYATPSIAAATVKYAAAARGGRAMDLIDSLLRGDSPFERAAAAEALGLIRERTVLPRLTTLLADRSPQVRAAAFGMLMETDSANGDFYIDQALHDSDFVLQALGVEAAGKRGDPQYLPLFRTLMEPAAGTAADVRRSVVGALPPFLSSRADSAARELLRLALRDAEAAVRRDASQVWDSLVTAPKPAVSLLADTRLSERAIARALAGYAANPRALISTSRGNLAIELRFDVAPLTVMNFIELAEAGFYDGLIFHRVVPNFVVQGGDPRGDGWGGPGYYIRDEYSAETFERGAVGIATSGKDTGGSQFFITLSPQPHLEGRYTLFGRVREGMETADRITIGDTLRTVRIVKDAP